MLNLSLIICSHNPRVNYLRRVLDALRNQSLPKSKWELLIVDNASTERLESAWDISWHPNARHIFEGELGLAYARQRGMQESSSELLVFVDDDNVLDPNYLSNAMKIGQEWPQLGVWGSGSILPEFEVEPENYLNDLVPYLALRSTDSISWSNVPTCVAATPWGAGLCTRANVARAYFQKLRQSPIHVSGRRGNSLLSGEDVEISYVACSIGLGMAIFPELKLIHLIPKERTTEDYLVRLFEGTHTSEYLLAYKWRRITPRSPFTIFGVLNIIANAIVRRGIERRMYYAQQRAARSALKIIKGTQPNI